MGTNFYLNSKKYDEYEGHIGKRSAAGWYCWDCKRTLCMEGESYVHKACKQVYIYPPPPTVCPRYCGGGHWFDECPDCGVKVPTEDLSNSSGGRELGFNKSEPKAKSSVASCSSFAWAKKKYEVLALINKLKKKKPVVNEYGDEFTLQEFLAILEECPIQHYQHVGKEFC